MSNKTNKISLRLNNEEYTINCKYSNMTASQYIRALIMGNVITENKNNAVETFSDYLLKQRVFRT